MSYKSRCLGHRHAGFTWTMYLMVKNGIILTILTLFILLPKILCLRVRNKIQPCERHISERTEGFICSLNSVYTSLSTWHNFQSKRFCSLTGHYSWCPRIAYLDYLQPPSLAFSTESQDWRDRKVRTRNRPNLFKWAITWLHPMGVKLMKKSNIVQWKGKNSWSNQLISWLPLK